MKIILSLIISGALVVSGFGQTRNVLVGTNSAVVQPTNFWSADAANARAGLGLGSSATNPATAFQPSSITLSNFSSGSFMIAVSNGGTGSTNASDARTALGLGTASTNPASAFQPSSAVLSNFSSGSFTISISNGGSGATTAGGARTNFGLGTTNAVQFGSLSIGGAGALLTEFSGAAGIGWQGTSNRITFSGSGVTLTTNNMALNFGAGNTNGAAITRTNLELGWSALTNTTASGFQASLFGANTNPVLVNTNGEVVSPTNFWQVAPITTTFIESQPVTNSSTNITAARFLHIHSLATNIANVTNTINLPTNGATFNGDIALVVHQGPTNSMTRVRTAGSTNDLVTMTRFDEAVEFVYYNGVWEFNHNLSFIEPIYFSGTNAAANAAASRTNLGLGATNDVVFNKIHAQQTASASQFTLSLGQTNTGFRGVGTALDSSAYGYYRNGSLVYFVSSDNNLTIQNGIAFEENAIGVTRTNLGLPLPALTNTNVTNFRAAIGLGATNDVTFKSVSVDEVTIGGTVSHIFIGDSDGLKSVFEFDGGAEQSIARTNLGLPLPALTNTSNVTFQSAVFTTNTAPTNTANVNSVGFNTAVRWMEITLNISGTNQTFRIPLFQ